MRRIKVGISLLFVAGIIAALAGQTFGYPPLLVKAKKFGAKDCTFCHVDPDGGPPWNERGQWLVKEKERRGADTVDVEWLANYKPGQVEAQKPADAAKTPAKADDKKPAAGKPDPKTFDDYVGEYQLPQFNLVLTHEGDKLFGQPPGDQKEELQPQDDGSFLVTNVNAKVTFVRDDKGKVIEIVVSLGGQEMKGKKIK
ncbi:MAG TPA: DUF3471 domain-containing protein [Blastocatellia bacterium]|nr:DUF3471 domain-containing protein [Blastocatellia bacterium]